MVIQPGGDSVGADATTTATTRAIPTLANGNNPKWCYFAGAGGGSGASLYVRIGSSELGAAQAFTDDPTAASPVGIADTSHPFSTGDVVFINGSAMEELNNRYFTITDTGTNTYTLDDEDGTGRTTGAGGSARLNSFVADATATNSILIPGWSGGVIINVAGCSHYNILSTATISYSVTPLAGVVAGG